MNNEELIRELVARLKDNPSLVEELKKVTPVIGGKVHTGDIGNFPPSLRRAQWLKTGREAGMGPWQRSWLDLEIGFQESVEDNIRRNPGRSRDQAVGATVLNFVATVFVIVGFLLVLGSAVAIGEMIRVGDFQNPDLWKRIVAGVVGFGMVIVACVILKKTMSSKF